MESPPHCGVLAGGPRSVAFLAALVEAPPHGDGFVGAPAQRLRVVDGVRRGEARVSARSWATALEYPQPRRRPSQAPALAGPLVRVPSGLDVGRV